MTDLHPFPDSDRLAVTEESTEVTRRFRSATYDGAIEAATAELGPGIRVISANRIRRGGLGGFFATDLGVEIAVVVDAQRTGDLDGHRVADRELGRSESKRPELEAIEEVLALSDDGLETLLREIEQSGSRTALPSADSPAGALSTFADHLALQDGDVFPVLPGTAPSDGWGDADWPMATMPAVAEALRRQADEVSRDERSSIEAIEHVAREQIEAIDHERLRIEQVETVSSPSIEQTPVVEQTLVVDESVDVDELVDVDRTVEMERSPEMTAIGELASIPEIPRIDPIPLIDEANGLDDTDGVFEPILPGRVVVDGTAPQPTAEELDWQRVLELEQQTAIRQESRRQEAARAALRRERELTFQTVVARRALVDRELAARASSEHLGLVGGAASTVVTPRQPEPVVLQTAPPPVSAATTSPEPGLASSPDFVLAPSPDSVLADLDELLRQVGVSIPQDSCASRHSDLGAADGRPVDDVTRVSVAFKTPEGVMIEMVADADGPNA